MMTVALLTLLAADPPGLEGGDPRCTDCVWQDDRGLWGSAPALGRSGHPVRLRLAFLRGRLQATIIDAPVKLDEDGSFHLPLSLLAPVRVLKASLIPDGNLRARDDGTLEQDPAVEAEVLLSSEPGVEYDFWPTTTGSDPAVEYDFQPNAATLPGQPLTLCVWASSGDCVKRPQVPPIDTLELEAEVAPAGE